MLTFSDRCLKKFAEANLVWARETLREGGHLVAAAFLLGRSLATGPEAPPQAAIFLLPGGGDPPEFMRRLGRNSLGLGMAPLAIGLVMTGWHAGLESALSMALSIEGQEIAAMAPLLRLRGRPFLGRIRIEEGCEFPCLREFFAGHWEEIQRVTSEK